MRHLTSLTVLTTITLVLLGCGRQRSTTPFLTTPPSTAVDNDIYVADDRGRIRALRPDGSEQWTISLSDEINSRDRTASRDIRIDFLAARSAGKIFGLATQLSGSHTGGTILFELDANHLLWQVEAPYPEQMARPSPSDLTQFMKQLRTECFMRFPGWMANKCGSIRSAKVHLDHLQSARTEPST